MQLTTAELVEPDRYRCGLAVLSDIGPPAIVTLFNATVSLGMILLTCRLFR